MVADQLGATRTPEVFVLDDKRVVRYHGRIDDQYLVGAQRDKPSRRDLAVALDELLAGKPVSQPTTAFTGCRISRARKIEPKGSITYSGQVAAIVNRHCVECHREGELAPFSLASYELVAGWAETIREVVSANRMPPWFADPQYGKFSNDCSLSDGRQADAVGLDRQRLPAGQSGRAARAADVHHRLADRPARPGLPHGRAVHGAGRRDGRLSILRGRAELEGRHLDFRGRGPARQPGGRAPRGAVRRRTRTSSWRTWPRFKQRAKWSRSTPPA